LQGINLTDQGNYIIRPIKEFGFCAILDDIGPLKMPFLAYTGWKIAPFPDATALPPRTLKT